MVYSYYPGCTLKNKAQDLDRYARMSAEALGFTLQEIEEWQCCGAVYPLASDEIATKLSAVRALNDAKEKGQDLVTLCSACHHVLKRVNITEIVVVDYGYYIQNTYRVEDFAALRDALSLSAQEQLCVSGAEDPVSVVSADGVRRIIQW